MIADFQQPGFALSAAAILVQCFVGDAKAASRSQDSEQPPQGRLGIRSLLHGTGGHDAIEAVIRERQRFAWRDVDEAGIHDPESFRVLGADLHTTSRAVDSDYLLDERRDYKRGPAVAGAEVEYSPRGSREKVIEKRPPIIPVQSVVHIEGLVDDRQRPEGLRLHVLIDQLI